VLSEYGELKSDVIRLKYKTDHDLAGLENGNRLMKMVLDKPSIPYVPHRRRMVSYYSQQSTTRVVSLGIPEEIAQRFAVVYVSL